MGACLSLRKREFFELDMRPLIGVNGLLYFRESLGFLEEGHHGRNDDFIQHVFAVVGEVEGSGELEESGIEDEQVLRELSLVQLLKVYGC